MTDEIEQHEQDELVKHIETLIYIDNVDGPIKVGEHVDGVEVVAAWTRPTSSD